MNVDGVGYVGKLQKMNRRKAGKEANMARINWEKECDFAIERMYECREQVRVNKVLAELNTDIHKSVNQFITDAIDFYANSFGDENLLRETREQKKEEYISKRDLDGIREELKNDVKNEIIMLLGAAIGGGAARVAEGSMGRMVMETVTKETATNNTEEPTDSTMMEMVDNWG